jgi:Zn-dependent M28 family amino/carboxypeptidase
VSGTARRPVTARPRVVVASGLAVLAIVLVTLVVGGVTSRGATASRFDGQAAFHHVERLVAIGPRPAGSPAAARTRDYLVAELKRAGLEVRVEPFEARTPEGVIRMANVVAVVPGRRPDVVMIAGHYDTKVFRDFRFVGANDGGSSAALLVELARALAARRGEYTYWIAFFDGEEARGSWTADDSLYGSRHMAEELRRTRRLPRAVVVADMIGDRDLDIRRESTSTRWLTDLVWDTAARLGHGRHFLADSQAVEDDHAPFMAAGVPGALLIDFDFPPWHTAEDTLDKVSAQSLQVVGDVLLGALPAIEGYLSHTGAPARR